jgi:hypothetical protein
LYRGNEHLTNSQFESSSEAQSIQTARQIKATEKAFVMLLNSNIKQENNDPSAKHRHGHLRVAGNLQGCKNNHVSNGLWTGQSMKTGFKKKSHLVGALSGLSAVLMSASFNPASALMMFTDANGNLCNSPDPTTNLCPDSKVTGHVSPIDFLHVIPRNAGPVGIVDFGSLIGQPQPGVIGAGSQDNGSGHLGMYVTNGGIGGDVTLGGGGYTLRNGGVSTSDTAGLVAPGTNSASYRESGGGGGLSGTYDASRFVGPNQKLLFNGAFDYSNSSTNFGGVGAGSTINSNNYSFTGTGLYSNYDTYLALTGSYQFGNNSEFNSSDNSTGSYRSDGYDIDATVGHVFWLLNTMSQTPASRMAVKALPKPSDGYAIGLDLSGHLGYQSSVAKGFTDSAGFVFGDERVQGGETGLKAKLFATVQNNGLMWTPYVTGTVDWRFNYSHIANFPGQAALATGDAVTFDDATTFVGARVGLDVKMTNGWIVGANGFYEHSSDTEIIGGRAYVKIPLGPAVVTARY